MIVYPLWHVGHQNEAGDDGSTVHVDESGVFCDESDGDDVKLLGIYSTLEGVEDRMHQARLLPGFRDEPECFHSDPYELDQDDWIEGFVRVPPGDQDRGQSLGGPPLRGGSGVADDSGFRTDRRIGR
ncbi:hypothetical protein ABT001_27650 [Streptomyces sp. NPDC002793]|uniref:hypothetical protein n=1 Tax=Streptomyces sp. NPDC002793 TaxID=3154432 RepID=UPI00332B447A